MKRRLEEGEEVKERVQVSVRCGNRLERSSSDRTTLELNITVPMLVSGSRSAEQGIGRDECVAGSQVQGAERIKISSTWQPDKVVRDRERP